MKLNKVSILYSALEILTRLINYFYFYILNIPILKIIPSTPLLILSIFPNINFRRAFNSVIPYIIFSILYQIFYILIYGDAVFSIYKSMDLFLQYFSLILIFEVIDRNYSKKWKNTIPNLALIMLFVQVIGYSFSPLLLKDHLFSTNVIAWGNLVIFNKFFPSSDNKLSFFDFFKAILSLFLMNIIGSRACIFMAILILLTALTLRIIKSFNLTNSIYIFYCNKFLGNKLRNLLLFICSLIIPYYLIISISTNYLIEGNINAYQYIEQIESCVYIDKAAIDSDEFCDLFSEQIFLLRDPSALIRTLSDTKTIDNILKSPIKLFIPLKNKEDKSSFGSRNYLNRSHNLVLSKINENGIIGILLIFFNVSKYDKILRNKNLKLNFISPYLLFLGIFISNDIFPIFPLLLYTRIIKSKNEINFKKSLQT